MTATQPPLTAPARPPRPDVRLDLLAALGAGALAAVAYLVALTGVVLPPQDFSVMLLSAAPLLAALAWPVYAVRSRADGDLTLGWFTTGLGVGLVAMLLQLVSFPAVSAGGGPLQTGSTGSAQLYLLFHAAPAAGAVAGVLHLPTVLRRWYLAGGTVLAVAAATNLLPSPALLRGDGSFTMPLIVSEWVLAAGIAVAVGLWSRGIGRAARPLRGWAAVALSLSGYDVLLNAVAAQRFQPVWWASLSLRVATFAVLAAGGIGSLLAQLGRLERYTDTELGRSDEQLSTSLRVTERLLASAEALSGAVTERDVCDAVSAAAREATGLAEASVLVLEPDPAEPGRAARTDGSTGTPWLDVLRSRTAGYWATREALAAAHPGLAADPEHRDTSCLAVLPLLSAGTAVGLLAVRGRQAHVWTAADRELLGGLAAQAAPALQRALLFERQRSAAELLQRGLLPQRLSAVAGVTLAARYLPGAAGSQIGGDWYDCLPVPGGRVAFVVGDVMGKGLPAAARMGQIRHAVRVLATIDPSPSAVLAALDALPDEIADDWIVTLVYVLLDPASGLARLGRAGHLPPVLVRPDGAADFLEGGGSPPLGVTGVRRHEATVQVPPGGTLLLYTDGLVEDRRTGLEVGLPTLLRTASRLVSAGGPDNDVDRFVDDVLAAMGHGPERQDDTCLLAVRLGTGAVGRPARLLLTEADLAIGPAAPGTARQRVGAALADGRVSAGPGVGDTLVLLCSELVTNAVVHAAGRVRVRLWLVDGRARLEVRDGSAALPAPGPSTPLAEAGRGMMLVSALADDWGVELDGDVKTVWLEIALHPRRDR